VLGTQAAVFDINLCNQETGGTPYVLLTYSTSPFSAGGTYN